MKEASNTNSCIMRPILGCGRKVGLKMEFAFLSKPPTSILDGVPRRTKKIACNNTFELELTILTTFGFEALLPTK
jgi:hypothetical protein